MIDFSKIKTISIKQRKHKVTLADLIDPSHTPIKLYDTPEFNDLIVRIKKAREHKKPLIVAMGAHTIKTGMSLLLIDLMKRGIITHIATNGAGPIHDFEIALIGETSEYVEDTIETGLFGMIEETGVHLNAAIQEGAQQNWGYGYSIGKKINDLDLPHKDASIFYHAYTLGIPATVHVAIGTDIIHQHPTCDGAAIGKTSYLDFKIFTDSLSGLEGGVLLNIGSSVILPEVFLKSLSIVRNLGYPVKNITTANLDMFSHYRPNENVVKRPTSLGGKGFMILERHEVIIPSLHYKLTRA